MLLLKIPGVLALLLVLLCMVRLQILVTAEEDVTLDFQAAFLRFRLFPPTKKKRKEPEEEEEPEEPEEPEMKGGPPVTFTDIRDALHTLPRPLWRALKRILRGVRIHPLSVTWRIGGLEDPAEATWNCERTLAALYALMPQAERFMDIPKPELSVYADYESLSDSLTGEAGVSVRVGTLIGAGLVLLFPAVGLLRRFLRRRRKAKKTAEHKEET